MTDQQQGDSHVGDTLLVLNVGFYGAPRAGFTGEILQSLEYAYSEYLADSQHGFSLQIDGVEISSLIVHLREVVTAAGDFLDAVKDTQRLSDFVRHVAVGIQTLVSSSGTIPDSLRRLIVTLVWPVDSGAASHAKLSVQGSNNTIIYIEQADARAISAALGKAPREESDQEKQERALRVATLAHAGVPFEYIARAYGTEHEFRVIDTEHEWTPATLLFVDGEWMARPQGLFGALLPATIDEGFTLPDGDSGNPLAVRGRVIRHNGIPIRFYAKTPLEKR